MFRLIGSGTEIIFNKIYFVLPQLALSVEFPFEILYVGAPPQLAHYCKLTESQLLCLGAPPTCTLL
ncbi:hypothetical protein B8A18_01870 [Staphylococcus aureus]|nr:hypothetical protein B7H15_10585 [Staphylococcus aureus]ARH58559.1 hypothetical protein BJN19_10620 [Staphylococcus aureus]OQZ08064.1 hypothetical protein BZ161_11830 [Staphylococcus aureus]OQZ11050.1 hypothetical protein BZ162_11970 [Staphylococcus aureus]ORE64154.1 hypothetical protein B6C85_10970 [Staphylococcus aureus]